MKVLRTPDECFESLPDYPFEPHFVDLPNEWGPPLRIHYLDEGDPDAPTLVMLHGVPTWSFLFRHLVPPVARAGYRVLVPDLVGFGKSDKPGAVEDYTYERMVDWTAAWFDLVHPSKVTLLVHDWGGLLGLRVLAKSSRRFRRVIAVNTGLPTGRQVMTPQFSTWQQLAHNMPVLPIGQIVNGGCFVDLPPEVVAAYDAPFPDESFKSAARALPCLVPTQPDDPSAAENRQAWQALRRFKKPFLTVFGDLDPITAGAQDGFKANIPGAAGQPHTRIRNGGHFVIEDRAERLTKVLCRFLRT